MPAAGALVAVIASACGSLALAEPDWFTQRLPLPACGQDDEADGPDLDAQRCLLRAYDAGEGAELVTTATAPTGRGLVQYLRVHENGTVEIFIQHVGTPSWDRLRCERLVPTPDGDPAPAGLFTAQDCASLPLP